MILKKYKEFVKALFMPRKNFCRRTYGILMLYNSFLIMIVAIPWLVIPAMQGRVGGGSALYLVMSLFLGAVGSFVLFRFFREMAKSVVRGRVISFETQRGVRKNSLCLWFKIQPKKWALSSCPKFLSLKEDFFTAARFFVPEHKKTRSLFLSGVVF